MRRLIHLVGIALLVPFSPVLTAHADEVISDPAPQEELQWAPGWVSLAFEHEIDPGTAKLVVLNSKGENVTVGSLIVEFTQVTTQLQSELNKDTYTVQYRVADSSGDPIGGTFQFAYGKGKWTEKQSTWSGAESQPPEMQNPDPVATKPVLEVTEPSDNPTDMATSEQTPSVGPTVTVIPTPTPEPVEPTPAITQPIDPYSGWLGWAVGVATIVLGLVILTQLPTPKRRRSH